MQFARQGDKGETVCLFLEVIPNHVYEKSRFLRELRDLTGRKRSKAVPMIWRRNRSQPARRAGAAMVARASCRI